MSNELSAGAVIRDKYQLLGLLGKGGFGEVWQARDLGIDRPVAVKLLHTRFDEEAKRRFANEAKALGKLSHDHCLKIFDFGETPQGQMFLVTELIDGVPLKKWLQQNPPLEHRIEVVRQTAEALSAAHREGIIHRDLKPDNILISSGPRGPFVTVLDFGIAKLTEDEVVGVTKTGDVFGTPGFMSPEQLRGQKNISQTADVYSLGIVMFELFEGRPPFEGGALELAMKHLSQPLPAPHYTPPHLRDLILAMTQKAPEHRPQSMTAVIAGLQPHPGSSPVAVTAPRPSPSLSQGQPQNHKRSNVALFGLVVALLVGIAAALAYIASQDDDEPAPLPLPAKVTQAPVASPLIKNSEPAVDLGQTSETDASVAKADAAPANSLWRSAIPQQTEGCNSRISTDSLFVVEPGEQGLVAYIPPSYRPDTPTPFVVALHDFFSTYESITNSDDVLDWVDRTGVVLLMPREKSASGTWTGADDARRVVEQVKEAGKRLCLDRSAYFVLGFGNGGEAALKLSFMDTPTAVASIGFRQGTSEAPVRKNKAPLLFISPLRDAAAPARGGVTCGLPMGEPRISIDQQEATILKASECGAKPAPTPSPVEAPLLSCERYDCKHEVTFCRLDSGRSWPGMRPNDPFGCSSSSPSLADEIWTWFYGYLKTD